MVDHGAVQSGIVLKVCLDMNCTQLMEFEYWLTMRKNRTYLTCRTHSCAWNMQIVLEISTVIIYYYTFLALILCDPSITQEIDREQLSHTQTRKQVHRVMDQPRLHTWLQRNNHKHPCSSISLTQHLGSQIMHTLPPRP